MNLLLDTHVLAWWVLADQRLSTKANSAIQSIENTIFVSVVSVFEMGTKFRIGKWPQIGPFTRAFDSAVQSEGFEILTVDVNHAKMAGLMDGEHRDPFDRLLAAQAITENLQLVSGDAALADLGATVIW